MHIDNDDLIKFENGTMEEDELIEFLSHLDRCDFCLEQMMTQESNTPAASAPAYLADQILGKADSGEVQFAKAANKASHKVQLLYYGLQTAAGIAVALFLLFSVPEIDFPLRHLPIPCRQTGLRRTVKAVGFIILPEISDKASVMEPALWLSI